MHVHVHVDVHVHVHMGDGHCCATCYACMTGLMQPVVGCYIRWWGADTAGGGWADTTGGIYEHVHVYMYMCMYTVWW